MKYIFKPYKLSEHCFLIEALYWIAFNKYPAQDFDIKSSPLMPEIKVISYNDGGVDDFIYDIYPPLLSSFSSSYLPPSNYLTPAICKKYNLPVNPDFKDYKFWLERAEELAKTGIWDEELFETEEDVAKAKQYLQEKEVFNSALSDYLDIFKTKLILALYEGKIKAFGIESKKEYTLNVSTHKIFDNMKYYGENCDENLYPDIKDGDKFYATSPDWWDNPVTEIPNNYWIYNKINWEISTLQHEMQRYVYVQVNVDDLMKFFPIQEITKREVARIGDAYIFDTQGNTDICVEETRGRKPKMNYDEVTLRFIANIGKYKGQKLESIVADFQSKFPQVQRTTLLTKLSPLWKAANGQK